MEHSSQQDEGGQKSSRHKQKKKNNSCMRGGLQHRIATQRNAAKKKGAHAAAAAAARRAGPFKRTARAKWLAVRIELHFVDDGDATATATNRPTERLCQLLFGGFIHSFIHPQTNTQGTTADVQTPFSLLKQKTARFSFADFSNCRMRITLQTD